MPEGEIEVEILDEWEVVTYPVPSERRVTVAVLFQAPGLPPLTVWVPKEEDTPEHRAAVIRAKIQAQGGAVRKTVRV